MLFLSFSALCFTCWSAAPSPAQVDLSFNSDYSSYSISINNNLWFESGTTYFRNEGHVNNVNTPVMDSYEGIDDFGSFTATRLTYTDSSDSSVQFINIFKVKLC